MALGVTGSAWPITQYKKIGRPVLPISASAADIGRAGGAAATAAFATSADRGVAITRVDWSYRTAPTAPTIQISDGTLTWGPFNVVAAVGLQTVQFDPPLLFTKGATVTVTLGDGTVVKDLWAQAIFDGLSPF